jgi:hypothetical protein
MNGSNYNNLTELKRKNGGNGTNNGQTHYLFYFAWVVAAIAFYIIAFPNTFDELIAALRRVFFTE